MFRTFAMVAMFPLLLGNSRCDPFYNTIGLGDLLSSEAETAAPAENPGFIRSDDETPYLKIEPVGGSDGDPENACSLEAYSPYVGGQLSALETSKSSDSIWRVIRPREMITFDFRPERMNIQVDENNNVIRLYCG